MAILVIADNLLRTEAAGANRRATSRQPFVFSLERLNRFALPAPAEQT